MNETGQAGAIVIARGVEPAMPGEEARVHVAEKIVMRDAYCAHDSCENRRLGETRRWKRAGVRQTLDFAASACDKAAT